MAFNIFSTLNQNLQNFGGDAYDAYQAGKNKVGNVASTINTNLQNFGGDLYDAGNQIKNNVSNFATQSVNTGKQVANQIGNNVSNANYNMWNSGMKSVTGKNNSTFSDVGKIILAPADLFMQDVTKIGNARKSTEYGLNNKDKDTLMSQMLDEGTYSDDEIIQAVNQLDAEEKARKQKEFADWQTSARENASTGRKLLSGAVDFAGGAAAGMMRLPAGVTDFVSGGTDYTKDTMQGINDFTSRSGAAKVGDIAGQIAGTALIPGVGRIAPSGTSLAATAGRGAVYGGAFGGLTPIMNKGSEATGADIGESALTGAAMGAVTGPLLEKGIPALIKGTKSGIKAGQYANGSISDKIGAGTQAFGKSIGRQTMKGTKEAIGSVSSAYQNAKPFVTDTIKKPYKFTQDKVQSLLSNSSDKTKNTIAQTYGLENQEIGALRNMGEKGVSDAMKKMEAIDKTALEGGGVNSIYDDLHKEIMTGVGRRSKEISTLEAQKDKILQSSPVVVTQAELESIFDDVLKAQGIQRTQKMTKKGIKNVYTVVGEGNITKGDIANIEKLYNEVFRTKGDVSALNMNTRIKNLQGNLYNSDGAAVYGSNSMTSTAKSIVAKVNDLLKKKLPPEYGMAKEAQSKIFDKRNQILKYLKEEDNALALLSDDAIARMSEEEVVKLINDSIAGNKMALVLRRLANSTTTGGDAKQLANIIKEFTGVDAESKAIALRAIAKLTGNQQILNELGGLIEKGIMKGSLGFIRKTLAPSPDKVIKAVATKPPIVSKAKPKATKPPIVPKAKPKATTESALKTTPVVPEKKSIVAKKEVSTIPITDVKKEPKFIRNGGLTDDNGIYKDHRYKNEVYKKEFIANSDIEGTVIKKGDRVAISEESGSKGKRYVAILQKGVKDENGFYITSEPNIKLSNFYKDSSTPKESAFKNNKGFINPSEIKKSLVPKKGADEAKQFYDDLVYAGNSPIVAQRETAKRFGTIRAMSASKAGTMDMSKAPEALKSNTIVDLENPIVNEQTGETLNQAIEKLRKNNWSEKDISKFRESALGKKENIIKKEGVLDTVNPTGGLFVDYTPSKRSNSIISSKDLTTLDKTLGKSPDDYITIYRGTVKGQKEMNPGDFVTDLPDLAKSYAGGDKIVISKKVRYSDVIDSIDDGGANEYLYIPKEMQKWDMETKATNKTKVVPKVVESKAGTMELPEALVQEAKKYKSADEFVNSHLFHGSPNKIEGGELKYGMKKGQDSGGIFLTDSGDVANVFTFGKGTISYISPSIKNKVIDLTTPEGKNIVKSFIGKKYKTLDGDILEFSEYDFDMMFPSGKTDFASVSMFPEVISKIIKDNKKIGIAFNEYAGGKVGKTYQILEGNIPVKTESQLKQIYEQANKPKATNKK